MGFDWMEIIGYFTAAVGVGSTKDSEYSNKLIIYDFMC